MAKPSDTQDGGLLGPSDVPGVAWRLLRAGVTDTSRG
jgi:hypothetical protein